MKKNKLISSLIIAAGFPLTQLSILLYTPALPFLHHSFATSQSQMLFSISMLLIGYTLGNLIWGSISDHIGRRSTIIAGLGLFIITALSISFMQSFVGFCICLTLLGFIAATFTSVGNAYMRDTHGKHKTAIVISYIGIAMAATPVIAPILGTWLLNTFSWHAIYYFMMGYAVLMLTGTLTLVTDTPVKQPTQKLSLPQAFKTHLKNKAFLRYVISLALCFGALVTIFEMLAIIYTQDLSLSLTTYSYLSILLILPYPLTSFITSKLVGKHGTAKLMRKGILIALLATAGLLVVTLTGSKNITVISLLFMLIFVGVGLNLSMGKAGAMTSVHHYAGSAASLMKFIQSLGAVVLTAINAQFQHAMHLTDFVALILCGWVVAYLILRPQATLAALAPAHSTS